MEQHGKGLSNYAIAKMFSMTQQTVSNIVRGLTKMGESPKFVTSETTAVPLASTERGANTLVSDGIDLTDASASILSDLSHIIDGA